MATGIGSPLALGGLYPSVDGRYVAANGKPFTSKTVAETALNGFPSKLSESCVGLTVLVKESGWTEAKEYWIQPKGTTPETYGLVEKGAGVTSYDDLDNKPSINNIPLSGNKTAADLNLATAAQGQKADTSIQGVKVNGTSIAPVDGVVDIPRVDGVSPTVAVTSANGQHVVMITDAEHTGTNTHTFTVLDGADGLPGHNPCLGVFADAAALPTTDVQAGDYAYATVTDSTQTPAVSASHIFRYDGTAWQDNGAGSPDSVTAFDGGNGPAVASVKIVDDLDTGGITNVPSAEAVKGLKEDLYGRTTVEETDVNIEGLPTYTRQFYYVADGNLDARAYSCISASGRGSPYLSLASYRGKRLRVVGNLNSSYVYMTFLTGSTTYASSAQPLSWLVQQNVLSSIHQDQDTGLWNPVIRLGRGEVWEGNIPDDAVTLYFTTWTLNEAGTQLNVQHVLPSSITIIDEQRTPGDIDILQQEVAELHGVVVPEVVDNLDTDSATAALSASQGKRLADTLYGAKVTEEKDGLQMYATVSKMSLSNTDNILYTNISNRTCRMVELTGYETLKVTAGDHTAYILIVKSKPSGTISSPTLYRDYVAQGCEGYTGSSTRAWMAVSPGATVEIALTSEARYLYWQHWYGSEGVYLTPAAVVLGRTAREGGLVELAGRREVQSAGAGIAFAPGTMTEDGAVVDAGNILISAPVALTDGYFLQVTPQYRIYRVHTVDTVSGRMVDFAGEFYYETAAGAAEGNYVMQSNAKAMAGYAHVIEVVRADGGEVSAADRVVEVFFTRQHLRAMGYERVIPQNTDGVQGIDGEVYRRFLRRSDMVQRAVWPTLAPVYASNGSNRTARFRAGIESIGINYSEPSEWSKYVPNHVTLRTYLTALLNRHSVMYTEKIDGAVNESRYGFTHHSLNSYAGAYYGTVCTGFTTYLLGLADVRVSANWGSRGNNTWSGNNFMLIANSAQNLDYDNVVSLIQPMDFFWNSGHCWACKEVFVNDDGERVFVIVEQTTPVAKERFYTAERLIARLKGYTTALNGSTWRILRYKDWTAYPATDTLDWAGVTHDNMRFPLPSVWSIDPDISTFAGEYAAFLIGDSSDSYNNAKLFLNARRGGEYTTLEIYLETDDPDADPQTTPVDTIDLTGDTPGDRGSFAQETIYAGDAASEEDWLRVDLTTRPSMKTAGKYKARLVGAGQEASGWTHFLLASVENLACTKSSSSGKDRLDSFSVIGGKPYLVRDEGVDGMADGGRVWLEENSHFTLDAETGAWTLSSPVEMASGGTCIKLYVLTDYGVVVKRVSLT